MVGITAPGPEHEKQVLFLWIGVIFALVLIGVSVILFLLPRVLG